MKRNPTMELLADRNYAFSRPDASEGGRLAGLLSDSNPETARKVECSITYMREHINQPLQVATLAGFANVSPSHFFALFKQLTGRPPMDFFTRMCMYHACELLETTSASVKEIAAALGYDDPFYFSRVFKAVHRVPPSRYRAAQTTKANRHEPPAAGAGTSRGNPLPR